MWVHRSVELLQLSRSRTLQEQRDPVNNRVSSFSVRSTERDIFAPRPNNNMSMTHKFILPSGFECEVKEMTGKHQRLLTEKKGGDFNDKLNTMLVDILARVGDVTNPDLEFVTSMLAADRKAVLVMCRHFTLDFPEVFKFTYTFKGDFDLREGEESKHFTEFKEEVEIPTPEIPITPYPGSEEWPKGSYKDIPREKTVKLKKSGLEVSFKLLDGKAEARALATGKDKETSSHTPILMRNPTRPHKGDNATVPVAMDSNALDKLGLGDIEQLRKAIQEAEGEIDTVVILEHPYKDQVEEKYQHVHLDLLQEVAFFFPSQAM